MTEEEIITCICAGGKAMDAGVKALYRSTAQPMLRFFIYKGMSGDDAKDVLQDTFVKIVRSASSFSGGGSAKSWVWQVARNSLIDHQRKQGVLGEHETAVNDEQWEHLEATTAAPVDASGAKQAVDECVSNGLSKFSDLHPDRAYVLTLQMEGLSIAEIGERIGRNMPATKEYLSQCKKRIKPFIEQCFQLLKN